jgi:hypothetical protein
MSKPNAQYKIEKQAFALLLSDASVTIRYLEFLKGSLKPTRTATKKKKMDDVVRMVGILKYLHTHEAKELAA